MGREERSVQSQRTAATLAMESAGLTFRTTKNLDIVLHIEALVPAFGRTFWNFVEQGHYGTIDSAQARAWLDLSERKANGEPQMSGTIKEILARTAKAYMD